MSGIIGRTNLVMSALCVVTLTGCVSPAQRKLDQIADRLAGSFSSAVQAEADPDNYFDIRLRAVRIWQRRGAKATEHSPGCIWLYVEQAAAVQLDRPYRQRVYAVSGPVKGESMSDVYLLPGDPLTYAGAWADPVRFDAIRVEDLELRSGCTIYLNLGSDDVWRGATRRDGMRQRASRRQVRDIRSRNLRGRASKLGSWLGRRGTTGLGRHKGTISICAAIAAPIV